MQVHELKTDPYVYDDVSNGHKLFEIRKNDRNFKLGDFLHLKKTRYSGIEMKNGAPLDYTGAEMMVRVDYILKGPIYGLADGWCIMGIRRCV